MLSSTEDSLRVLDYPKFMEKNFEKY